MKWTSVPLLLTCFYILAVMLESAISLRSLYKYQLVFSYAWASTPFRGVGVIYWISLNTRNLSLYVHNFNLYSSKFKKNGKLKK